MIAALQRRRQIRCACLGTVLKRPMSTITLVEDLGRVAMAGMALAGSLSANFPQLLVASRLR